MSARTLALLIAAATTLAACAAPTEPAFNVGDEAGAAAPPARTSVVADLAGGWEGEIESHDMVLLLDLTQTGNRVSGLAEFDGATLTVSGTVFRPTAIDPPATQLTLAAPSGEAIAFEASLIDGRLHAQLNGVIFTASDVVLSRTD